MERAHSAPEVPTTPQKRPRSKIIYSDRFIPSREGVDLEASYKLYSEGSPGSTPRSKKKGHSELDAQKIEDANRTYSNLLRTELFGIEIDHNQDTNHTTPIERSASSTTYYKTPNPSSTPSNNYPYQNGTAFQHQQQHDTQHQQNHVASHSAPSTPPRSREKNLFTFSSARKSSSPTRRIALGGAADDLSPSPLYSLSPVGIQAQRLLLSPKKQIRPISKVPLKVLDAPELQDDFYLNLVDWGHLDVLGVGLGTCVFLWHAKNQKVTKLCDLGPDDNVTSVSWIPNGHHLSVGTNKGLVHIWDAEKCKKIRTMTGHTSRVGSMAWNSHILSSGSRDRVIYHRDVRMPEHYVTKLIGHKQEVCGLKWNGEDMQIASGGNDNKLFIWDGRLTTQPLYRFNEHQAAVKAIAWNPHQHGILASGGGTADRRIKFWNTLTGTPINEIDTGSQVCNLAWSKNSNELVSTHGYSQNQIIIWKYPSMSQVAQLTGHTFRVLYLAMSPDGQTIVTGAGDETLRFWNVFAKPKGRNRDNSVMEPFKLR